jgi:hypothetical protein
MRAMGIARSTIGHGPAELRAGETPDAERVRRPGGGRKPLSKTDASLLDNLRALVEPETRDDPQSLLLWTCKSLRKLSQSLRDMGPRYRPHGDRGGQLSQRRHARDMSEFRLRFAVEPLALPQVLLRLRTPVKSSTKATPWCWPPPRVAAPTRTGTRMPSLRRYSFSKALQLPAALSSARARSSAPLHLEGVSAVRCR